MSSRERAQITRRLVVETITEVGLGHVGGDLSVTDILAVLFEDVAQVDPARPDWPQRDRIVVSKGHAAVALYASMALSGFLDVETLRTFAQPDSQLNGHPARTKLAGVETSTGPLGHGLPVAVGMAIGAKLRGESWQTYVITGDGEMQEGSNWEAIMLAGHRGLSNLICIVDRNRLQQGAPTETTNRLDPLDEKFRAFGWECVVVDGHDHEALRHALTKSQQGPLAVIAETTKGKGVSFMEGLPVWHHKVPSAEEAKAALEEIGTPS
jgi:transketolase